MIRNYKRKVAGFYYITNKPDYVVIKSRKIRFVPFFGFYCTIFLS